MITFIVNRGYHFDKGVERNFLAASFVVKNGWSPPWRYSGHTSPQRERERGCPREREWWGRGEGYCKTSTGLWPEFHQDLQMRHRGRGEEMRVVEWLQSLLHGRPSLGLLNGFSKLKIVPYFLNFKFDSHSNFLKSQVYPQNFTLNLTPI